MRTFKDIHTNKLFNVQDNQVTDQFGNVATLNAHDWLLMQGADLLLVAVDGVSVEAEQLPTGKITKTRVKDGHNTHRGMIVMCVDCESVELSDRVSLLLNDAGFDTPIEEESDKFENGSAIIVTVLSGELEEFNSQYKAIKQLVK